MTESHATCRRDFLHWGAQGIGATALLSLLHSDGLLQAADAEKKPAFPNFPPISRGELVENQMRNQGGPGFGVSIAQIDARFELHDLVGRSLSVALLLGAGRAQLALCHSLQHPFTRSATRSITHSLAPPLAPSPIHSLHHSLHHRFLRSVTHSTRSVKHSVNRSITRSCFHQGCFIFLSFNVL